MRKPAIRLATQGVIEHIDEAFLDDRRLRALPVWPGKGADDQQQRQRAQDEQEYVPQPERTATRLWLIVQKAKRGELEQVGFRFVAQMQPERRGNGDQTEPQQWIEKGKAHRHFILFLSARN